MIKVESIVTKNSCMDVQLYSFISDFRNLTALIPPDAREKISFTKDTFTVEAMQGIHITFSILELEPYKLIKLGAEQSKEFCIWVQLKQVAPYDTRIRITLHADIPKIASLFSKKKLQTFVDTFAEALSKIPVYAFQTNNMN